LLSKIRKSVLCERRVQAGFISYLGEINTRRAYASLGYSSLFKFVVEDLGLLERSALKRIQGARVSGRVSVVLDYLRGNKISLSVLSLLSPHVTDPELLTEFQGLSRREAEQLLVKHFPKEVVLDRVESRISPLSSDKVHVHFTAGSEFAEKLE